MTKTNAFGIAFPHLHFWRECAVVSMMVMSVSWLVPWYRSLTFETYLISPGRAFFVFFGIMLLFHMNLRILNMLRIKLSIQRIYLLLLLVGNIIIGLKLMLINQEQFSLWGLINRPFAEFNDVTELIPVEFLVALAVMLVSWRGINMAKEYIGPHFVIRNFQLGILMFFGFFIVNTFITGESPGVLPVVFLSFSLLAMAAARINVLSFLRGGKENLFNKPWVISLFLIIFFVTSLANFLAGITSKHLGFLQSIIQIIIGLISILLVILISPALFILPRIANQVPRASEIVNKLAVALSDVRSAVYGIAKQLLDIIATIGIAERLSQLKSILLWGTLIIISLLILMKLPGLLFKTRDESLDERQSTLGRRELWQLIKQFVTDGLKKINDGFSALGNLPVYQQRFAAARIRRIYDQLMKLGKELGKPRRNAQTPLEYQLVLGEVMSELTNQLDIITQAYLVVRYGEFSETEKIVNEVQIAWEQIHKRGIELIRKYKQAF